MNFKKLFDSYFKYEPQNNYKFTIPNEQSTQKQPNSNKSTEEITNIFPSLKVNLEYMKTRYNTLINSDIIIRQFTLNARGKQYDAFRVNCLIIISTQSHRFECPPDDGGSE